METPARPADPPNLLSSDALLRFRRLRTVSRGPLQFHFFRTCRARSAPLRSRSGFFAMSESYDVDDEDGPRKASVGAILAYLWKHWSSQPVLLGGFLCMLSLAVACDLLLPWAAGRLVAAIGEAQPGGPAPQVTAAFAIFALIAFGYFAFRNMNARFWVPFAARNMKRIVTEAFDDVQRFSADWHGNNFAGATVRRVSRAMWAYDTISDSMAWFVLPAFVVLSGLTLMTALHWPVIGLFLGLMIVAYVGSAVLFARFYIAGANRLSNAADTRIGAALADAIGSNAAVKAFGAEADEATRFAAIAEDWRGKANRTWMRFTNAWVVQNLLLFAMQAGLVGLVVREWAGGRADAGDAAFALTSFFVIMGYLRNLGDTIQMLQRGFADIEDVVAYRAQAEDVSDAADAGAFQPCGGAIRFENVSFDYRNTAAPLYQDFSLDVAPGETVALVGPTGAGKSTFVKLVQRLYDVDAGAIVIDGQDVRTVTQASLRRHIATVPQDPALFHRSLRENIAYARPDATEAEIEAAARRARAHDFIAALPKRYETEVGERGVKLSGGERQRVALARAFLANAPILILDEATSSLDTETERDVQAAMAELMAGRTTIVIAHRLSTVRAADRILVFEQGRIVEQGRHADLVQRNGLYARLNALATGDMIAAE
jgi:ATP-binding cassette subfamily B protein